MWYPPAMLEPVVYAHEIICLECKRRAFRTLPDGACSLKETARLRAKAVCKTCGPSGRVMVAPLWTNPLTGGRRSEPSEAHRAEPLP